MDIPAITTAIGTLGFPIVACGALFWQMNQNNKANNEKSDKMTEAINNNTIAITKLMGKIGGGNDENQQ